MTSLDLTGPEVVETEPGEDLDREASLPNNWAYWELSAGEWT